MRARPIRSDPRGTAENSGAIEKYATGRAVRFEPDGDNRWTVIQNGHAFEVLQDDLRDNHGWTRHT
jgi:hypothetical protein